MNNQRYMFNNVRNVEIEISSQCNRSCSYCPKRLAEREKELFPMDLFVKIMGELKEIGYFGAIAFHQYNEPLMEYDYLLECMATAKRINPKSRLELYTNGDYLTKKRYKELRKAGLNRLVITCHLAPHEKWTAELGEAKVKAMMKKLGIRGVIESDETSSQRRPSAVKDYIYTMKEFGYEGVKKYPFRLQIRCMDLDNCGSTRMGTVTLSHTFSEEEDPQTYYCYSLMHALHISYKGNAYICCDTCEGVKGIEKYIIGSVKDEKVYDIFAKKRPFIEKYLDGEIGLCRTCAFNR